MGALASWLGVRPHSAAGLVDRLMRGGLMIKGADAKDKRRVILALTPKAERKLKTLSLAHREELRRLQRALVT
jgi:DNA-binding MarR family transcriptional regulator